jgi:hypothetical protein
MIKKQLLLIYLVITVCFIFNTNIFAEQGMYIDISQPTPIGDRTIPMNATTNPVAFTVSDSDGGPLIVLCTSSQPSLVPNDNDHIIIDGHGQLITVDAQKNEKKHLTARIIPKSDQFGMTCLTFKVIDSGGLFATKSMNLTVTTDSFFQYGDSKQLHYTYVPSYKDAFLKQLLFSTEAQPIIKISAIGEGFIRLNQQRLNLPFQTFATGKAIQIEAFPSENFQFVYWSGDIVDTENPLNIIAEHYYDIQAVFVPSDQSQMSESSNWKLRMWLSESETQNTVLSEIYLGITDNEPETKRTTNSEMCILSDINDDECLSVQTVTFQGEQFRTININSQKSVMIHWAFDQDCNGLFELIDAQTKEVYVSDMQSIYEWHIPENQEIHQLLLHYIP